MSLLCPTITFHLSPHSHFPSRTPLSPSQLSPLPTFISLFSLTQLSILSLASLSFLSLSLSPHFHPLFISPNIYPPPPLSNHSHPSFFHTTLTPSFTLTPLYFSQLLPFSCPILPLPTFTPLSLTNPNLSHLSHPISHTPLSLSRPTLIPSLSRPTHTPLPHPTHTLLSRPPSLLFSFT